jgi:hypothetical protein
MRRLRKTGARAIGLGSPPATRRALLPYVRFPGNKLFEQLGQALIGIRDAKHSALGSSILYLVCLGARFLGKIMPMLRTGLAAHLVPPAVAHRYSAYSNRNRELSQSDYLLTKMSLNITYQDGLALTSWPSQGSSGWMNRRSFLFCIQGISSLPASSKSACRLGCH